MRGSLLFMCGWFAVPLWAQSWPELETGYGGPISNIYVDVSNAQASDTNKGFLPSVPLYSLRAAVDRARGLTVASNTAVRIRLAPGIYRITNTSQQVNLDFPRSPSAPPLMIVAETPGTVWFQASAPFTQWSNAGGNRWTHPWSQTWGPMAMSGMVSNTEEGRRREVVVIGGRLFRHVLSVGALQDETCFVDVGSGLLHVMTAVSPITQGAEVSIYPFPESYNTYVIKAQDIGPNNLLIRGLGFRYYGGAGYGVTVTYSPLTINNGTNVWLDRIVSTHNTGTGMEVSGWINPDGPHRGHSNVRVTASRFLSNGMQGATLGFSHASRFEDCDFIGNGWQGMWGGSTGALFEGIKTAFTRGALFTNCRFLSNGAAAGLWLDTDNSDTRVVDCRFIGNRGYGTSGTGIYIENNAGPITVDRCQFQENLRGITLSGSSNVTVKNSVLSNNDLTQFGVLAFVRNPADASNWLTGQLYGNAPAGTIWPSPLTLRGNTFWAEGSNSLLFGEAASWVAAADFSRVTNGYVGESNRWGAPGDSSRFRIATGSGYQTTWFGNWQRYMGEGGSSRWLAPMAPMPSPVGWWPMDETTGTNFREVHGLASATASQPNRSTNIGGRTGFLLSTNRLLIPDRPEWRLTNGFTLSAWIHVTVDPPSNNSPLFQRPQAWRFNLGWGLYGGVQLRTNSAGWGGPDYGNFPTNQWVLFTGVWDRANGILRYYQNGALVKALTNGAFALMGPASNTGDIFFTTTSPPSNTAPREMVLADIRIWDVPLEGDAIDRIGTPYVPPPLPTPLAFWPPSGLVTNASDLAFSWAPVPDAAAYQIRLVSPAGLSSVTQCLVPAVTIRPTEEGAYQVSIDPLDASGYASSNFAATFTVDRTPPVVTWKTPLTYVRPHVMTSFSSISPDIRAWVVTTNHGAPPPEAWTASPPDRVEVSPAGYTTLVAHLRDGAGNTNAVALSWEAPRDFRWVGSAQPGLTSRPGVGWTMAWQGADPALLQVRIVDGQGRLLASGAEVKPGLSSGSLAWDGLVGGKAPPPGPLWILVTKGQEPVLARQVILVR